MLYLSFVKLFFLLFQNKGPRDRPQKIVDAKNQAPSIFLGSGMYHSFFLVLKLKFFPECYI